MWGEPREGTEAHKVKQLAEKKKREAQDKKLDDFFSKVFHDTLVSMHSWSTNKYNKDYIHPNLAKIKQAKNGDLDILKFSFRDNQYEIKSKRGYGYDSPQYEHEVYMNSKKVFAISESEDVGEYITTYRPFSVDAFVNEDWVPDFEEIDNYREKISQEYTNKWAEDPERTRKTKEDFGIEDEDLSYTNENSISDNEEIEKPFWNKMWFWILLIIFIIIFSS